MHPLAVFLTLPGTLILHKTAFPVMYCKHSSFSVVAKRSNARYLTDFQVLSLDGTMLKHDSVQFFHPFPIRQRKGHIAAGPNNMGIEATSTEEGRLPTMTESIVALAKVGSHTSSRFRLG